MNTSERRIVVEVVSGADVRRLEERDDDLRKELTQLRKEVEALRRQQFDLIAIFGDLKRKFRG